MGELLTTQLYLILSTIMIAILLSSGATTTHSSTSQTNLSLENTSTTIESSTTPLLTTTSSPSPHPNCPSNASCEVLAADCLQPICKSPCQYGQLSEVEVKVHPSVPCIGNRTHSRYFSCRYCYQTEEGRDHRCIAKKQCDSPANSTHRKIYRTNCTVHSDILCLGQRTFIKNKPCKWTNDYSWSTTLLLSITLGGFGADRFYLGHWKVALGKLFSFGGLGVWTLIDVILIAVGYVTPLDGSQYS